MYTFNMRIILVKFMFCIIAVALVAGFTKESANAFNHKSCVCCAAKNCHNDAKCHAPVRSCACSYQVVQACYLVKAGPLPKLNFSGYLKQAPNLAYGFLPSDDIFHPPKA